MAALGGPLFAAQGPCQHPVDQAPKVIAMCVSTWRGPWRGVPWPPCPPPGHASGGSNRKKEQYQWRQLFSCPRGHPLHPPPTMNVPVM